jgi:hypothetical protein
MTPDRREVLADFCALLAERLGGRLLTIMALGQGLELLVVTKTELSEEEQASLADAAEPFLPQFVAERCLIAPDDDRERRLLERMRTEGLSVWPG